MTLPRPGSPFAALVEKALGAWVSADGSDAEAMAAALRAVLGDVLTPAYVPAWYHRMVHAWEVEAFAARLRELLDGSEE